MSATVRMTTVFKAPFLLNFSTSRGHWRRSCEGARTSVALVGMARVAGAFPAADAFSYALVGHWISFAMMAPIVMAVLPYPTWSAMIPPRTRRRTLARPSMRRPSVGSTASATSSSTNGSWVSRSRSSIQCSERSCSGLSGTFSTFQPGGCFAYGSARLDLSAKGSSGAAVSISRCLTTCHSISGVDFFSS